MMSDERVSEHIRLLMHQISPLHYVLDELGRTSIRYGLYAGAHVSLLTGNRKPVDVDFLVHDDDLIELTQLFPFAKTKDSGTAIFLYIGEDDVIEFMGKANISKKGVAYPFRLTDLAAQHVTTYAEGNSKLNVVDPADTLLLKALLRRGPDQGKNDIEDIRSLLAHSKVDIPYLKARLEESGSTQIVRDTLRQFGLNI